MLKFVAVPRIAKTVDDSPVLPAAELRGEYMRYLALVARRRYPLGTHGVDGTALHDVSQTYESGVPVSYVL